MQEIRSAEQAASAEEKYDPGYYSDFDTKPFYEAVKRIMDIILSAAALIAASPLMLIISLMIIIKDPGNPFYTQERVGKDEKIFKMYKLRSMYKNSDKLQDELKREYGVSDVSLKLRNDPRIIKGMGFIRSFSIDELPQLINIIKGDMSIIGPRPLAVYEYNDVKDNESYKLRYKVRQGLSCYWQIWRTDEVTFDERMKMDVKYVKERSFLNDIKILYYTIGVILKHENY